MSAPTLTQLGRYQLVELLGQGGMGEVYLAKMSGGRGFEKACIVKAVLPKLGQDKQFVERFEHEAKMLVMLQHQNIAQVYDMAESDGRLYMALEYVNGVDLARLGASVTHEGLMIPLPVALYIAAQAAEGLGYAHRKTAVDGSALEVVHRDVTPQNVMVSFEGEVKVIDFGIARSTAKQASTQTATVVGKLGYMSPEQARAEPVDARTDQYALAVVLWEMLSGVAYITPTNAAEMMQSMAVPKHRPLLGRRSEIDAELDAVVMKALSVEAKDRYATTDEFGRALLKQLNRFGGAPAKAQVGQFVMAHCSEAFEKSQRLLSRISTWGVTPPPVNQSQNRTTLMEPRDESDALTHQHRPLATPMPNGSVQLPPPESLPTEQEAPKSKTPMIFAAAGLMLVLAGGLTFFLLRNPEPPGPPPPTVVELPLPPEMKGASTPSPSQPPPETKPVETKTVKPATLVEAKKVGELFAEDGSVFLKQNAGDGLKVGQELQVVGAPLDGNVRPLLGSATVKQQIGPLTLFILDDDASAVTVPRFVVLPSSAGATTAKAEPIRQHPAPDRPAEPNRTPPEKPDRTERPEKPAVPEPTNNALLQASLDLNEVNGVQVPKLNNDSTIAWTRCTAILPGQKVARLPTLQPGFSEELGPARLSVDPKAPSLRNVLEVRCAQGTARLPMQ